MAARRRFPDPYDPANDAWWRTHDRLEAIALDAARVARAAAPADGRFVAGDDVDVEPLRELLRRWWWTPASLDVVTDPSVEADL